MKSFSLIVVLSALVALAVSQATFNTTTDVFDCAMAGANYCGGDSLKTNIIIRCAGFVGQPGNCDDNLAGISPLGVKTFAPCYQTSVTAGDAACSFGGIVYPDVGKSFPIPSNTTNTTKTSSSLATTSTYEASSSTMTSLAPSSSADTAVKASKPYSFGFTTSIGGVKIDVVATQISLEPGDKAPIMTPHVFLSSGVYNPSPVPYFPFKSGSPASGSPAPFPTAMKSLSYRASLLRNTAVSISPVLLIATALPDNLPSTPSFGPGHQVSAKLGNSSNYSTDPSGTAIGTGGPSMTSPPFMNSADITRACVGTVMVGLVGLGFSLL